MNFLRRFALQEKKTYDSARLAVVEIARVPHASEFVSFMIGLRTYQHAGSSLSKAHIHLLDQQYAMVYGNRLPIAGLTKDRHCTPVTSLKRGAASRYDSFKPHCDTVKCVLKGTWIGRKPVCMGKLSQSRRSVL